jgi:hypothetical protein
MRACPNFLHLCLSAYIFFIACMNQVQAQTPSRAPASYILDDDMIVVPINIEKTFLDEIHEEYKGAFDAHRKTVENWMRNEELAEAYGLENRGIFQTSTLQQRQNFLQRNYLRFFSKKVERDTNQGLQNWWQEWTADDEIDSISNLEKQDKIIVRAKKKTGQKTFDKKTSTKVGRQEFKFGFQPRLEIGMLKVTMDSPYFKMRAWLGANGNQEVKLERSFRATKTKAMVNYYMDQERVLAAIDQRLTSRWSLRFTHDKKLDNLSPSLATPSSENNITQLRFRMGF